MSNKVKDIDIKNRAYYFFDDINMKNFDLNIIKIDEMSYKNIQKSHKNNGYGAIKHLK